MPSVSAEPASRLAPPALSDAVTRGIEELRDYLRRVAFRQVYKFVASSNHYSVLPSVISQGTAPNVEHFFDTVLADCGGLDGGLELLQCLMFGRGVEIARLNARDQVTAELLVDADLLRLDGSRLTASWLQLINAFGSDLLIDRRIHFPSQSLHEVYVGFDSYLMIYYADQAALEREHRAIDLCTGSGISALFLSQRCDHVVATDIGPVPLRLVQMNRLLNGKDESIAVRDQPLDETLDGSERFDVLTCNPPFVAFPPSVDATLYSRGTDLDGLGYMRTLVERLPDVLNPGGTAYLVADLVGDLQGPYFVDELRRVAARSSLAIDVYVDGVISAEDQVPAFAAHIAAANPQRDPDEITEELRRFQREELKAERYYLSTLRLEVGGRRAGVRVFRRYAPPQPTEEERWPQILLRP